MKKASIISLSLLIIFFSCKKENETIKVTNSNITESVYASGKVKALHQYNVYSTVSGVIQNITINVGEPILKNEALLTIDNFTSERNTENARISLELSALYNKKGSDKLKEAEVIVEFANEKLKSDSTLYVRQKKLWEQNIGSQIDFEQKKLAFDNSKINLIGAQKKLLLLKTQLQNELSHANLNYDINKKSYNDYTIKSTIHGKVYDILKECGELITPQTPLAIIGSADTFLLELAVDENDIVKINLGQKVLITMDSYKGQLLEGTVQKIHPIMNERSRTFNVEAYFNEAPKKLFPNLSAEANIIIQTKKNAITIPNNYIIDGKYVLVNSNEKREVKLGIKDYQLTEVIAGLKENEIIYKP